MPFKEKLNDCIENNRVVEIQYTKYNSEKSERKLSEIEYSNDFQNFGYNNDHISAFCHLRNERRTFKINRISKIRLLGVQDSEWIDNPEFVQPTSRKPSQTSGCYIATMAYGNYDHPQVLILRKYRDDVLEKRIAGKLFIKVYYFFSPKLVRILKNNSKINSIIRKRLDKIIKNRIVSKL